jgi:hypothetical protein
MAIIIILCILNNNMNTLQVYGLPRSGTNFIEWSIINNFIGVKYNPMNLPIDIPELRVCKNRTITAAKHTLPNLKAAPFALAIYKDYEEWIKSLEKNRMITGEEQIAYQKFMDAANSLDPTKCLILNHKWCVENYEECLKKISEFFKIELKKEIEIPRNHFGMNGAMKEGRPFEPFNKS